MSDERFWKLIGQTSIYDANPDQQVAHSTQRSAGRCNGRTVGTCGAPHTSPRVAIPTMGSSTSASGWFQRAGVRSRQYWITRTTSPISTSRPARTVSTSSRSSATLLAKLSSPNKAATQVDCRATTRVAPPRSEPASMQTLRRSRRPIRSCGSGSGSIRWAAAKPPQSGPVRSKSPQDADEQGRSDSETRHDRPGRARPPLATL